MNREELIDRLQPAIQRQEHGPNPGMFMFSNPGWLRYWDSKHPIENPQAGHVIEFPKRPVDGHYVNFLRWKPANGDYDKALAEGLRVHRALIWQHIEGKYNLNRPPTLRQMIAKYAPSADGNDPKVYTENVAAWAGVDPDVVLKDLITE